MAHEGLEEQEPVQYIAMTIIAELRGLDRDQLHETIDRAFGCPMAGTPIPYADHDCPVISVTSTVVDSLEDAMGYVGMGDQPED